MASLTLTLKNFRCFEDRDPAVLHIQPGMTALVGPNNAGKSSLLRMFYEFRTLFGHLSNASTVVPWLQGLDVGISLARVPDASALQCDHNQRPMTVRVECSGVEGPDSVSMVEFTFSREQPTRAKAEFWVGPYRAPVKPDTDARQTGGYEFNADGRAIETLSFVERTRQLSNTVYMGPFRNVLNEGAAEYYDLNVGNAFVSMWDQWKNGDNRTQSTSIKEAENAVRQLFGFASFEVNPTPDKRALRVFVNGRPFSLHEQGAGLAQFILAFGTAATRRPALILIDEPELNLHASLQVDFVTTLGTFASHGLIFSTHSMGLARSVADTIYSVQRKASRSSIRRYEEIPNPIEFAGELSFSAFREVGFDRLLLVEGPTDVRTVQQLLRKLQKDHRVVIFPLLGHVFAAGDHFDALVDLNRIAEPGKIAALVDSERTGPGAPPHPKRQAFKRACEHAGFLVYLTERRAIENYFSERAIQEAVGDKYQALGEYGERGEPGKNWSKSLNWKIAHATQLDELAGTDLLDFLTRL